MQAKGLGSLRGHLEVLPLAGQLLQHGQENIAVQTTFVHLGPRTRIGTPPQRSRPAGEGPGHQLSRQRTLTSSTKTCDTSLRLASLCICRSRIPVVQNISRVSFDALQRKQAMQGNSGAAPPARGSHPLALQANGVAHRSAQGLGPLRGYALGDGNRRQTPWLQARQILELRMAESAAWAARLAWVQTTLQALPMPAASMSSKTNCGTCVVLPQPVSPAITTT